MQSYTTIMAISLAFVSAKAQFYEGCGETKYCFGIDLSGAEGCIESQVTYNAQSNENYENLSLPIPYLFLLLGRKKY